MKPRHSLRSLLALSLCLMALGACTPTPTKPGDTGTTTAVEARSEVLSAERWRTRRFWLRIDSMKDGSYRLASWSIYTDLKGEPDLVVENGSLEQNGKGDGRSYSFTRKQYRYVFKVNAEGKPGVPPGELIVYEDGQMLLHENGVRVKQSP